MAIAPKIVLEIKDEDSDDANTSLHVQSGLTVAQYGTFANDYANAIDDVVVGRVTPLATMTIPVDISGLTANVVTAGSNVEQIGAFQFVDANGEPVEINIPGILDANVLVGTDDLDLANVAIAAFVTMIETGNGTVIPCSVAESNIDALVYGRKETRARGRKR